MDKDKRIAELIAENGRLQREATILYSWQKGDAAVLEECKAANKQLREALSPFAEVGGIYSIGRHSIPDENTTMICITVGELRRAYQVTHVQTDNE